MENNKYKQLSISAFITAIVIGLGLYFSNAKLTKGSINWIYGVLLGISILIGLFFLYKSTIDDSNTEGSEWVNNLVERIYQVIPQIALLPPLIVSVIIVTQVNSDADQDINTNDAVSTILAALSSPTTEVSTTQCPTSTPIPCVTCCVTAVPSETFTLSPEVSPTQIPTPTETSTSSPTSPPTPTEIRGCVITYGLNVRTTPGVIVNPSNHAKMWLTNGACMTILKISTPEWAYVQIEGWVRLTKAETKYVVTVPPPATLTPTATQP